MKKKIDSSKVLGIVLGIIFLGVGMITLHNGVSQLEWVHHVATVGDCAKLSSRTILPKYSITYSYVVDNISYTESDTTDKYSDEDNVISIKYNPYNPAESTANLTPDLLGTLCCIAMGGYCLYSVLCHKSKESEN